MGAFVKRLNTLEQQWRSAVAALLFFSRSGIPLEHGTQFPISQKRTEVQSFWKDVSDFIFIEDDPHAVECLVVLGAPWIELIQHVANLYHQGISRKVFACGKYGIKTGKVNADNLPEEYRRDYRTDSENGIKRIFGELERCGKYFPMGI